MRACEWCGVDISAKRKDARFCSVVCRNAADYAANREKHLACNIAYYAANREERLAYDAAYYIANREKKRTSRAATRNAAAAYMAQEQAAILRGNIGHGPKDEYQSATKETYRNLVWRVLADHLNPQAAHVAFFPGKEGLELPIAFEHGFQAERLHAIDKNPALIATAARIGWGKEYPEVNRYGLDVVAALLLITKKRIALNAIHLDFCGNLSAPLIATLGAIRKTGAVNASTIVALNLLKGRDQDIVHFRDSLVALGVPGFGKDDESNLHYRLRLAALYLFGNVPFEILDRGEYGAIGKKSGSSPMTWAMIRQCPVATVTDIRTHRILPVCEKHEVSA